MLVDPEVIIRFAAYFSVENNKNHTISNNPQHSILLLFFLNVGQNAIVEEAGVDKRQSEMVLSLQWSDCGSKKLGCLPR